MPRNYVRKVKRKYSEKDMEVALSLVRDGYPVADVAKHIGIPRQTLYDNLKKKRDRSRMHILDEQTEKDLCKFFSKIQEVEIVNSWKVAREKLLQLIYVIKGRNSVPESWKKNGKASKDWLSGFRKRKNVLLSDKKPSWLPDQIIAPVGECACGRNPLSIDFFLCLHCSIWNCSICFGEDMACSQCISKIS